MSLINKMLQDLEARRASLGEKSGLSQEVRSLPPQTKTLRGLQVLLGVGIGGVVVAGVVALLYLQSGETHTEKVAPPAVSAPSQQIPPPPQTVQQQAAETVQVASAAPPAEAGPRTGAEPKESGVAYRAISTAKESPAEAKPATRSPRTPPSAGSDEGLKVSTSMGQPSPRDVAGVGEDSKIEKRVRPSTAGERAENEYRRALGLINLGRIQDAMLVLRESLREDQRHLNARLVLFSLLVEQQRLDDAQVLLSESLARDPAQPHIATRLARLQFERGDVLTAEETLRRSAEAAAGNAEFRAFHAAVLQRLNRHKEAADEYQAAVRIVPQSGIWWMGMAISLEADGRTAEAKEAFLRAKASGALSEELISFVDQKLKQLH